MSLVEIIVASAIISMSLIFLIQIAGSAIVFSHQSVNMYVASDYLEEGAEAVRTIRDNSWGSISGLDSSATYYLAYSNSSNQWSLSTSTSTLGIFTRTLTFTPALRDSVTHDIVSGGSSDSNTELVTVNVSWKESTGNLTKKLSFYISNIFGS